MLNRPTDAKVNCGSCTICCHQQMIYLVSADNPLLYKAERCFNPITNGPGWVLKHQADGACIHLVGGKCEVYLHRPSVCRSFDCGNLYASKTRAERREIEREADYGKQLIRRGREIHLERQN